MEVTPTLPANAPTPAPTPVAATGTSEISADFETFLKMLTVQMTNQDPLNPVDSADYAVQLATFSGVEQQVQTNDLLRDLAAQMGATGMVQMAGWVGKEARAPVAVDWSGSPVTVSPNPLLGSTAAELVIRDATGGEVQRLEIPVATDPIEWVGVGPDGAPLPNGTYSFEVVSYNGTEAMESRPADVYARIVEVQSTGGQTMLHFAGGSTVPATAVSALRDPAIY